MPILSASDTAGSNLAQVARQQALGRWRPLGFEVPYMDAAALPALAREVKRQGSRLWANSLFDGFIRGFGSDEQAMQHPDQVWGRMIRGGITIIQTDYPVDLYNYLQAK